MAERLLTPSKITAWLDCAHFLTLKHEVEEGTRTVERSPFGEMAQMLLDKGLEHERAVLARYRAEGLTVFEVPEQDRAANESFQQWVDRVGDVLGERHDVVFQMPFVRDGIRGIADFLRRVDDAGSGAETGTFTYEPIDAKLARNEAKPGHVLQLCFYAEAIAASTGRMPEWMHIELGSGRTESVRVADVLAYWRRLRGQLAKLLTEGAEVDTRPKPCDHCQFCEFELVCEAAWRAADSLVHVAGVRTADRLTLQQDGVTTIAALAELDREVADLDPARRETFVRQARLQVQARIAPDEKPPFELLDSPSDTDHAPVVDDDLDAPDPIGFGALPAPDDGDIFLDFEGHPFWHADAELFFLFGFIERSPAGEWEFTAFWAHTKPEESTATKALIDHLVARRVQFPDMHVYHYNHTERSSLERLVTEHGVGELALEKLITTGLFVDLLPIVKGAMQVGVEGYGLKHIERLTDYERGHEIDRGAGAVVEYERWMASKNQAGLTKISAYNEDDVRATRALRDWLVLHRPAGVPWRASVLGREEPDAALDERIEALHAFGPDTVEHLMGDLLGYWRRERQVVSADAYRLSIADEVDQLDSLSAIARLTFRGLQPQVSPKTGKALKWPWARFTFPPQPIDVEIQKGSKLIVALNEQEWLFFKLEQIDVVAGELSVTWDDAASEAGVYPSSLVRYEWFQEGAKLTALEELADEMLAGGADRVGRVGHAMLRRDLPAFVPGRGPDGGVFVGDVAAICEWATGLDRSYVPIQGPPGTGKTFTGAHMIRTLVNAGLRVGVTAMSHAAIDNLMQAVVDRFADEGDSDNLRAVRKAKEGSVRGIRYVDDNANVARGDFNVIAGTTWLFASKPMRENLVDVLVVDEAGQLGLADTVAATISATNVILLGDPQQLPQVSKASHPGGAGASALEHLLGDELTVPADRGVLLETTWRMHPDVCEFISEVMYAGKLHSHSSCAGQSAAGQTGLRWLKAVHKGCSTESPEEAAIVVAKVEELLGQHWTDQHGVTRPLKAKDFMVVAPYNDQRRCIEAALRENPATRGVEVGTVDKFQGREAAVVLFSMTTSSSEFMPRTADFLFSKNRLNVAISRARCLAYLICTDELLDTRARNVEEMELISALCSFVERAG